MIGLAFLLKLPNGLSHPCTKQLCPIQPSHHKILPNSRPSKTRKALTMDHSLNPGPKTPRPTSQRGFQYFSSGGSEFAKQSMAGSSCQDHPGGVSQTSKRKRRKHHHNSVWKCLNIQVKKTWCGIANPSPFIRDTTSCSKPTIYNQVSSISLETPQPPVMICNLALLQAQFSEVAPSVSVNVNTPDKVDAMLRHPFSHVFLRVFFHDLVSCSVHVFFAGQKIQQSARCWAQVPVFTGIYTLCKNRLEKCHWLQIWPRTRVHVWKKLAQHIVQGPKRPSEWG